MAEQAAGDDPEVWVVSGWVHARLRDYASAEKAFQRAIDLDPQKASPWIARGRCFAERGAADKAESDFTHAASLTPNELHQFLEAGWWVMGPIPQQQVSTAVATAFAGDPAQTFAIEAETSGQPATSLSWQPRQPDHWGAVTFGADMRQPNHNALAMTVVYSPDERTTTLWIGGHDRLRVWLNGQLVHEIRVAAGPFTCGTVAWIVCRSCCVAAATSVGGGNARRGAGVYPCASGGLAAGACPCNSRGSASGRQAVPYWEEFRRRGPPDALALYWLGCLRHCWPEIRPVTPSSRRNIFDGLKGGCRTRGRSVWLCAQPIYRLVVSAIPPRDSPR